MENICSNCRYWFKRQLWDSELEKAMNLETVGLCEKIICGGLESKVIEDLNHSGLENNAFIYTYPKEYKAGLITKNNFGCTFFELSVGKQIANAIA